MGTFCTLRSSCSWCKFSMNCGFTNFNSRRIWSIEGTVLKRVESSNCVGGNFQFTRSICKGKWIFAFLIIIFCERVVYRLFISVKPRICSLLSLSLSNFKSSSRRRLPFGGKGINCSSKKK